MMATIVVIDDDDGVRETVARMLKGASHTVHEAGDGDTGLDLCLTVKPSIVVTDILMPQKEGIETILALKRADPTIRIIAISGGGRIGSTDILTMARQLGADDVLEKPFRRADLLAAIDRLLAG
jgi:DNA-binding response OmpR family regulator